MKFMLLMLPTVPGTLEDRRRLRPIGRNNERYQQMLDELRKLVVFADEVGFDVFATTEHHFHSEGYETSVAPLLLYTDLVARTKRIKFSPLGLVLPAWDPIRAAEELAVLDHLTKGRVYAGFARGYQDRWVNVLGQQYHTTGAPMDGSAIDNHNRRVYEETLKVIKKAWTEDAWDYDGQYYKVPFPYEEGIRRWPVAEWTRTYGAPGEVDEQGVIRKICVVPKPYQQPHPPMFQPFSVSEATIRYTAQSDIVPVILTAYPPDFQRLCKMYQEMAAGAGRTLRLGESVGVVRALHFGRTEEEAVALLRHQLCRLLQLLRRFRFLGGVPHARGRRQIPGRCNAADFRVDRRADAQGQIRARRNGRPGQGRVRRVEADRRRGRPRMVRVVLRPRCDALGGGDAPDGAVRRAHHPGFPLSGVSFLGRACSALAAQLRCNYRQ
jgi:alkanesulfonate monooxygenase SsuD/methylene tetrahydromethanopterin reductase-like flavin-dependent oxidoreductase (luciferase family)